MGLALCTRCVCAVWRVHDTCMCAGQGQVQQDHGGGIQGDILLDAAGTRAGG